MKAAWTIARREIRSFFISPIAYVLLLAWVYITALSFYLLVSWFAGNPSTGGSNNPLSMFFGQTVLFWLPLLIFAPVMTMRLFAAERSSNTLEPLMTAPVRAWEVVAGKYLAAVVFWMVLWIPTLLYVWIISRYGDVDPGVVNSSYLGVFGIGLWYMAWGTLSSALATNQVVAAILGFLVLGAFFVLGIAQFVYSDETRDVLSYLSVWTHMADFSKGIVDTRYLIFDLTMTVLALFFAVRIVESRGVSILALSLLRDSVRALLVLAIRGPRAALRVLWEQDSESGEQDEAPEELAQQRLLASRRMHSIIGAMLVTLIVFEVNYLSYRHFERYDWTQDARFTLSERTDEVLNGLQADVRIVLLLSDAEPNFEDVRELVERYRAKSTRIRVEYVDPDKDPGAARRAAELYDIELGVASTGESFADVAAVVVAGAQRWKITRDDLFEIDFDQFDETEGPKVDVKAERALTGAIVQVTEGEATKICLTSGRGEWSLSGERSLFVLREELERENLAVEDLPAVGLTEVPETCDAVFVLGPLRAFAPAEARVLIDWVKTGGNVVLALDPVLTRDSVEPTGFESAAEDLGVLIDRTVVLEMDSRYVLRGDPTDLIRVLNFGEHETTAPLRMTGGGIAMAMLRSVRPTEGSTATPLLLSSEAAYAETDIGGLIADRDVEPDPDDLTGPIVLAVAVEAVTAGSQPDARPGRLVVVGDSDWLEPTFLVEPQFGNLDLLMSITGYATQRDALISIPPHRSHLQAVVMSEADVSGVALRIFGLLPLAIVLLGVAVWWSRRQ